MTKMTKEVANGVLLSGVIVAGRNVWSKDIRGDKRRASSMRVCPWNGLNSFQDQTI
ncbi:hypothetical protein IGI04_008711 [Brassica rapa subsp. trilocularis]|uniref:Uncharacterized protein n=1 Tax=Brassica rapa subsp. trilocularis TaxID=1813537 RepID=A0ABQ7NNE3_BRACM|nr:hypothetical protein IGI04_008711 [Brassica rapa subsp. trilocularis]